MLLLKENYKSKSKQKREIANKIIRREIEIRKRGRIKIRKWEIEIRKRRKVITRKREIKVRKRERIRAMIKKKIKLDHEVELSKMQSSSQFQSEVILNSNESNARRQKFTMPKLELEKFISEIKD